MKFSLKWLRSHIDLEVSPAEMLDRLTLTGTEVEGVQVQGVTDDNVVVGQILSSVPHPNADRLRVCRVLDGKGERSIVCGAKNYKDLDKVPLALPGAKLPGGVEIKESKMRGELSQGMLCSAKELALSDDSEGLLILPEDAPVGKKFGDYMPGDTHFEVEITSNRPDLLSYRGLARELAAAGVGKLKPHSTPLPAYGDLPSSPYSVKLLDTDLCPFYSLVYLTDVKVGPSPAWLKEAILATGHKPINNVVDVTNFILHELGQPLHAFSATRLNGKEISTRRARAGETLLALDGRTYPLTSENLVIADEAGPVALAGIMGGKPTSVDEQATEIVLEAAWFVPGGVRRTSRSLGLSSDSSYRYERRVDAGRLLEARDRAVALLQEVAGARLAAQPFVAGNAPSVRGPIRLRHQRITSLLGVEIPAADIEAKLTALGCGPLPSTEEQVSQWQPPSWRDDLAREVDLIEEVARLTGLANIPSVVRPLCQPESVADVHHARIGLLRRFLAGQGWDECVTDPLQTKEASEAQLKEGESAITLVNPLNELYTHLRPGLRSSLLQVASRSLAKGTPGCRLFEIGRVYRKSGDATNEPIRLGVLVCGLAQAAAWYQPERMAELYDLTGLLQGLEKSAGLPLTALVAGGTGPLPSKQALGIKTSVYYAEVDLTAWLASPPVPERYHAVSVFPAVRRDLAALVPLATPQATVEALIRKAAPASIFESVTLFDLFRDEKGEKIPADQKSLAYAVTFRSSERTLTEKEVNQAFDGIKKALVNELNCTFRDK